MFSFKAYFWNNEVYINEQYKYASNEILTAYLNTKFCKLIERKDVIYELKRLKRKLNLDPEMDYGDYENYNENVMAASTIFNQMNVYISKLPPYDKIINYIPTLEDILNSYSFVFEDGLYINQEIVPWETITEYGIGEQLPNGHVDLRLHIFQPIDLDRIADFDFEMLEAVARMNKYIKNLFDSYIYSLESYLRIHTIFKPFIENYLHLNSAFMSDTEIAKVFEEFSKVTTLNFSVIKCEISSFGYKVLKTELNNSILCEQLHFENLESFLFYDFFNGIKKNYIPNKCKHCGKYFLIKGGKYFSYCDRPLKKEPDKTCRDVGSRRRYDDKCKNDPVWQTYNRAYKAHYARYMKKKMTIPQFEEWSRFASELRDKALAEQIKFEDYYEQIRK